MKHKLQTTLQIIVALSMTGSMAYAMQPTTPVPEVKSVQAVASTEEPKAVVETKTESASPTLVEAPKQEKTVTWQDNPNNCNQDTQYISETAPFNCIDKPVETVRATTSNVTAPVASSNGSCDDWIAGAGINDLANAKELIRRESGCNPYAVNPSSGACGVAQELPCGKSGCSLGDGACQVRWMNAYVIERYGSWASAVNFHSLHNWY